MRIPIALVAGAAALALPPAAQASFTQEPGSPYGVGLHPHSVVATDFDRDGDIDLATVNSTASTVSVLLRPPGGGRFVQEAGSPISGFGGPNEAVAGDFNGDGRPDLAVSSYVAAASQGVSILTRRAAGGFDHAYLEASSPTALTVAHFGGDPRADVAVTDGETVRLWLRAGTSFVTEPGPQTPIGAQAYDFAAADFTGDGLTDLALTIRDQDVVRVLRRDPAGGFAAFGAPLAVPDGPWDVIADDFDRDGRPDLAVTSYDSDRLSILLRRGTGFAHAPGSPYVVGDGPVGLQSGDFDRDGVRDVAVANNRASTVTVLLRDAAGRARPDPSSPVATDNGAFGVDVADFNRDGRPDLAVSNDAASSVTVLRNDTPPPVPPPPPPPPNLDADGDGVQRPTDCDDGNPGIRPGIADRPGDGIDQDCFDGDAPFPLLARTIVGFSSTYPSGYTRFTALTVRPARAGDRIRLTCKGGGCPLARKAVRVRKDAKRLSLLRHIGRARLRKGAVVRLRVTRPETVGRVHTWRIRAPKPPKLVRRCIRPGEKKPTACPAG